MSTKSKQLLPIKVDRADLAFGGKAMEILPPYKDIPDEFKSQRNKWVQWQQGWFFTGLKSKPEAKDGIDGDLAMANLACAQASFEPKNEHKEAGVAYLASLWFKAPSEVKP